MTKKITVTVALLLALIVPSVALAQTGIPKPKTLPGKQFDLGAEEGKKSAKENLAQNFIPNLTQAFIGFSGVAAFFGLLYGGIRYITAYGKEENVTSAKKIAIYSLVGLIIAIFSYAIVSIITKIKIT